MSVEMNDLQPHICKHLSCKCAADGDFCGAFCEDVETSSDDLKCGCGHMKCDVSVQMGNESTFDATGS
ncbi:MAG TPA: hypothetical protein V6D22_22595 [Candidatus Obscuribacterales bacterium]